MTLLSISAQSGPLWHFFLMSPIYLMLCAYLLQEGVDSQKFNKFIIFIALLTVCIITTFIQSNYTYRINFSYKNKILINSSIFSKFLLVQRKK
ncbi:hypothetical protein CleRT_06110 [Candidatus Coxiella mudrowiae]|uniref:Uncharacterized protein n=1 Tax=Candidatus Coxiella mudrowiae TaxID=2054173 RepID=A0ABM5UU35_9COXI|nr:hypothetical protein CleRT_04670 [Candidatus Coxiella mudrowiae]AKQ33494.1 hypothetical protein CleRT_06110 [Candidatus Coxiella mudrowiae]